jgi:outer membrane protein
MKQIKTLLIAALFTVDKVKLMHKPRPRTCWCKWNYGKMPAMLDAQKQLETLSGTYDADYKNGWRIKGN